MAWSLLVSLLASILILTSGTLLQSPQCAVVRTRHNWTLDTIIHSLPLSRHHEYPHYPPGGDMTMHSEGIWGLMIAWVTVGHLGVTVGHFRATAGHLRVIKGPLRVRN